MFVTFCGKMLWRTAGVGRRGGKFPFHGWQPYPSPPCVSSGNAVREQGNLRQAQVARRSYDGRAGSDSVESD